MNDDWAIELARILDWWKGKNVQDAKFEALLDFARLVEIWEVAE